MKLLVVSAFFETHRGGVERVAGRLARHLADDDFKVTWLAADVTPPKPVEGVDLVPVPANNWIEDKIGIPVPIWGWRAMRSMWRAVKAADIVMLHDTLYMGNIAAYVAARFKRRPVIIVQHVGAIAFSNRALRGLMWVGDRLIGRRMLARADQVVFISQRIRGEYSAVLFRREPETIFNGVDTTIFQPTVDLDAVAAQRDALRIPKDCPVVLFAGRFVPRKGLALVRFLAERHDEAIFLLAGWGPIDPRDWGLANVRTTTADTPVEMRQVFQVADCLLLPSTGEGFPLVIQEALATGLPVICSTETSTADSALAEWCRHSPIDPNDMLAHADAWSENLEATLAEAGEAGAIMRSRRSAFAEARYGWPVAITRYKSALKQVAENYG